MNMDSRGHWHDGNSDVFSPLAKDAEGKPAARERPVIELAIGEMVDVVKADRSFVRASFDGAERNRVTLTPVDLPGHVRPYLELAEPVELRRLNGSACRAQVWDNRKGKIILRTLPVQM
jgi:hypothetical protein